MEDDQKQRALHVAAASDAVNVAGLLMQRGAEVDPYELRYSNTPFDFAAHYEHTRMIELLCRHSRDVWNLTPAGAVGRLREVLTAEPRGPDLMANHPAVLAAGRRGTGAGDRRLFLGRRRRSEIPRPERRDDCRGSGATGAGCNRSPRFSTRLPAVRRIEESARREHMLALYEQVARGVVVVMEADDPGGTG